MRLKTVGGWLALALLLRWLGNGWHWDGLGMAEMPGDAAGVAETDRDVAGGIAAG